MSSPSAALTNCDEQKTVRDRLGRCLSIRRLTALDTLRLLKAAGPVLAQNQAWLGMASLAMSVTGIDGIPLPLPTTEALVEAAVNRLGDEGLTAVADAHQEDAPDEPNIVESAGNLSGTPT